MTTKPTVAIIGVGLIGGSLGQALRRTKRYRVLGIARRPAALTAARHCGAIDRGSVDPRAVAEAELIVIGTPVAQVVSTFRKILPFLKPGACVSDVSSVKAVIAAGVAPLLRERPDIDFVGAHPLAGSHRSGVAAASPDLFRGATCVLVGTKPRALAKVRALWRSTGARTLHLSAHQHDAAVALTSHLPHVIAHALVSALRHRPQRSLLKALVAGSFRDATRVAVADPIQWSEIMAANHQALRLALEEFSAELGRLQRLLSSPVLAAALRQSQRFRAPLFDGK